jgi:hypothetical protein
MHNLKNSENHKFFKGMVVVYELTFILFYYIIIILFLINHETLIVDSSLF